MKLWRVAAVSLVAVSAVVTLAACESGGGKSARYTWSQRPLDAEMIFKKPAAPRDLRMFSGAEHNRLTWKDVMDSVLWAEVVVIGHQPNDPVALQSEAALVADSLAKWPWTVISLEALDRSQQVTVDAYLAGQTSAATFTNSVDPQNKWVGGYMPILDAAKAAGARVIAANVPPAYAELVQKDHLEGLKQVPRAERKLFSLPKIEYKEPVAEAQPAGGIKGVMLPGIKATSEVEQLRSATLAASAVAGLKGANARIIHIGAASRSDLEGDLVREIRARRKDSQILTVNFSPRNDANLQVEDFDRADVVVHSGI